MDLLEKGFSVPTAVAVDAAGNLYIADESRRTVSRLTPNGTLSTLAGAADQSGAVDGASSVARFSAPAALAVDAAGNVYVADRALVSGAGIGKTIRKITADGTVSTLAGKPGVQGTTDGTGTDALFSDPYGVAVDRFGTVYVADGGGHTVRKITSAGVVTTLAGSPYQAASVDGMGAAARFHSPLGVAVDAAGTVYIADANNNQIRALTPEGVVTTLAGATTAGSADGVGAAARFSYPVAVGVDPSGNVIVSDDGNNTIRKVTPAGLVTTLAGAPAHVGLADGLGPAARFNHPTGVAVDGTGNVFVADALNKAVRKIAPDGSTKTFFQPDSSIGDLGSVALDPFGNVFVAVSLGRGVRKYSADGTAVLFVANGAVGSADASTGFKGVAGIAVDFNGNVFVADSGNHAIRRVTPGGVLSTIAGSLGSPGSADGTGSAARFNTPGGLTIDAAGNLYVADTMNCTIRKITPASVVTTLAGALGVPGSADGTGSAASFLYPRAIAADAAGNLYVADSDNATVRKVTPTGVVTTLGGTPGIVGGVDGIGRNALFHSP